MANIQVNTQTLDQKAAELQSLVQRLNQLSGEVSGVSRRLRWEVSISAQVRTALNQYSGYVEQLSGKAGELSGTLSAISQQYQMTEQQVLGHVQAASSGTGAQAASSGDEESSGGSDSDWKYLWKLIGSAGIIGSVFGAVGQWVTGGYSAIDFFKGVASVTEKVAKAVPQNGNSFDWSKLFGLDSPINIGRTSTNWGDAIWDRIRELSFENAETVSDKIAVGAKWAGYALTAIAATYDNFTDPENTTFGRKLAESIGETAVKIGEGIAVGAAVTAAFAALEVAAPAVVIGGVTVFATWVIDSGLEALTGKDTAELISDTVLDIGEAVGETAAWAVDKVGEAAETAANAVKGWWNQLASAW